MTTTHGSYLDIWKTRWTRSQPPVQINKPLPHPPPPLIRFLFKIGVRKDHLRCAPESYVVISNLLTVTRIWLLGCSECSSGGILWNACDDSYKDLRLWMLRIKLWWNSVRCLWWQLQWYDTLDAQNSGLVEFCEMLVMTVMVIWHLGCSEFSSGARPAMDPMIVPKSFLLIWTRFWTWALPTLPLTELKNILFT